MSASADATLSGEIRAVTVVSAAHFFSHFYQFALPPLFPFLAIAYDVSIGELGLLISVLFGASGCAQVAAGFVVDRFGARNLLIIGAGLLSGAFFLLAFFPNYWVAMALLLIAGLGNSVFHPADFAIFQASVRPGALGRAYGMHGFAGNVGYMLAPLLMGGLAAAFGWQVAIIVAGTAGLLTVAALIVFRDALIDDSDAERKAAVGERIFDVKAARSLLSPAVVSCFVFYMMIAITLIGFATYSITVFTSHYNLPLLVASGLLSVFLGGYVAGILPGGWIADRVEAHAKFTATGFISGGAILLVFSLVPVSVVMFDPASAFSWLGGFRVDVLVVSLVLFAAGVSFGIVLPSRDLIVRKVAPEGSTGRVFGFVYSALDVGGAIAPAAFGWIIAIGHPEWMFRVVAVAMTIAGLSALLARALPKPVTLAEG